MAISGYLMFSLRARPGLFPTDPVFAFHSLGVPWDLLPCSLPVSLLNRAQPRASRQEHRLKSRSEVSRGIGALPADASCPAFGVALLRSQSFNYSALCNPSLMSNSPFSTVLTSKACLSPEKKNYFLFVHSKFIRH